MPCTVDQQHRLVIETEIPAISQQRGYIAREPSRPVRWVSLRQENVPIETIPIPSPRFIRPANQKWKVGLTSRQHLVQRALQNTTSIEPIIIIAESGQSILAR